MLVGRHAAELACGVQVGDGLALGVHDLGAGVAAGAALGVQEGLDHLDGVVGSLAEGAHGVGRAVERRVAAVVAD